MGVTVGDAVQSAFLPVLAPLGYVVADRTDDGATFDSPVAAVTAWYVPSDGELAVYVEPKDGGQRVQLLLYLRAIGSGAAARLGRAIAESENDAANQAAIFGAGLRDVQPLLRADPDAVREARGLRWWNTDRAGASSDIQRRLLTLNGCARIALASAIGVAACGPTIMDADRLPARVEVCGATWGLETERQPVTRDEAANVVAAEPVIFDVASGLCPSGACNLADFRVPAAQRRPCQELMWARVGIDAWVPYGMLHRL